VSRILHQRVLAISWTPPIKEHKSVYNTTWLRHYTELLNFVWEIVSQPRHTACCRDTSSSSHISYQSDVVTMQDNELEEWCFTYQFQNRRHFFGASKAILYLSCKGFDDMDVFVQLRKADSSRKILHSYKDLLAL